MIRDNSIYFDTELAGIYDETRPFPWGEMKSAAFGAIIRHILSQFPNRDEIRLLDAGSGTGRVALAMAYHYLLELKNEDGPRLRVVCVDRSEAMMTRFLEKVESFQRRHGEKAAKVVFEPNIVDIRDMSYEDEFDVGIAHWVFHTIADWRLAAFAFNRAMARKVAFLIQLSEDSRIYEGIDGHIPQADMMNHEKHFWRCYIDALETLSSSVSTRLSPAHRLGAKVQDDRVIRMLSALGWKRVSLKATMSERWNHSFTVRELGDYIMGKRAFTNSRILGPPTGNNPLLDRWNAFKTTSPGFLSKHCDFTFNLTMTLLSRTKQPPLGEMLVQIAADTIGHPHRRYYARGHYEPQRLWDRAFGMAWTALTVPGLLACLPSVVGEVGGFFSTDPFSSKYDSDYAERVSWTQDDGGGAFWRRAIEQWKRLAEGILSSDVYVLCLGIPGGGLHSKLIYPQVHTIQVTKELSTLLGRTRRRHDELGDLLDKPAVSSLMRVLADSGLIPFRAPASEEEALAAISDLCSIPTPYFLYLIPFPKNIERPAEHPTFGFMLGVKKALSDQDLQTLWSVGEMLFGQYIAETAANVDSPVTATSSTAIDEPTHASAGMALPGSTGARQLPPQVLLVTADEGEYKLIKQEMRRLSVDAMHDLAHGPETVCFFGSGINSSVWLHRVLEQGSGKPNSIDHALPRFVQTLESTPEVILLTGIAAGCMGKTQVGDVLVATSFVRYPETIVTPGSSTPEPAWPTNWDLFVKVLALSEVREIDDRRIDGCLVRFGLLACGTLNHRDPDEQGFQKHLAQMNAIGFEMEGNAGLTAVQQITPMPKYLIVKAVSDNGSYAKNKELACRNLAKVLLEFLRAWSQNRSNADEVIAEVPTN